MLELSSGSGLLAAIRSERLVAKAEGALLVVYVGAPWCPPCQAFERAFRAGEFDAKLAGTRYLHVDLDARGAELALNGYEPRVIPYFVVPLPDGKPSRQTFAVDGGRGAAMGALGDGLSTLTAR